MRNSMNANVNGYNVVVVGAGPIGITYAATLKAISNCEVTVIDGREKPTRNHGLKVGSDSVEKIHEVLSQAIMEYSNVASNTHIKMLSEIYADWKNGFIRTTKIELDIAEIAQKMGVKVLRGEDYKLAEQRSEEKKELQKILDNAHLIIGADGAHSTVRQILGTQLTDVKTLQYLVELKYQTDGKATPRSFSEAFYESAICGHIDIESMHKKASEENKPVTLHIFIDEKTYDALRVMDGKGQLKGVFGNSWTLDDIKKMGETNKAIHNLYQTFKTHLKGIAERGGTCNEEKISTLEMTVYRSEKSVVECDDKIVLLVGDARSGMVIERGFNKGLKEAALAAKATAEWFYRFQKARGIPEPLIQYEREVNAIFKEELKWAERKNMGINLAQSSVALTHDFSEVSSSSFESSERSNPQWVSDLIKRIFGSMSSQDENKN